MFCLRLFANAGETALGTEEEEDDTTDTDTVAAVEEAVTLEVALDDTKL